MVVDDDDVIFEIGFLLQGTVHSIGNGLGTVINGNDNRCLNVKLLFAEVGSSVIGRICLGSDCRQMLRHSVLHLHLHLTVAWIDIIELLDAGSPRVEFHFSIKHLVQMVNSPLTTEEQAQGIQSCILIFLFTSLHGKGVEQPRLNKQQ